jgi:flagellar hook-associated protein 2
MATTSATSATTGSNIDVASIVSQLMTVEQRPLTALSSKEASIQARISAYGSVKGALSGFQSALSGLSNSSTFQGLTASSSDSTMLTAFAASNAAAGSYAINVTSLAQSQKLVALGQASQTASIGSGASTILTFDFGTIGGGTLASGKYTGSSYTSNGNGTKTVTIDSTNNSLQGIRDAINAANVGVTASIINDGSTTPYRLALSSSANGISNSLKISVAGDATLNTLLAQDPASNTGQNLTETTTAQNANFTVNGVAVSKTSNSVSDVIQGITLNLLQKTTSTVNLNISQNTSAVSTAISGFVKAYNDLHTTLTNVSKYDAATKTGAILQGDFAVRTVSTQVRGILNTPLSGSGSLTTLSQIGVTFQKDGSLALDSTKLNTAMTNNFSDIAALFATVGKASDSLISYSSAASSVKPGSYAVNISQLATQGSVTGLAPAPATTITTGSNDTLNISVNGVGTTVTLSAGTYTAATLAAEVQTRINGASALSSIGSSVSVTQSGGIFTITSNSYGSSSSVAIGGNGAANLLGGTPTPTAGLDVAGTIDGVSATGSGQFLTSGSGNSLGLKIQVNGGALGTRGTVNFAQGYAYTLNQLSTTLLATNGLLDGKTTGLNKSIADIAKQRVTLTARLASIQTNYTKQFSALDVMLSSMNSTSTYLTQQLAAIAK